MGPPWFQRPGAWRTWHGTKYQIAVSFIGLEAITLRLEVIVTIQVGAKIYIYTVLQYINKAALKEIFWTRPIEPDNASDGCAGWVATTP